MALLPLYRVKHYIRAPKWAKFPEDFMVVGHSILDDDLIDHPDIASHRWSMNMETYRPGKSRARRMATVDGKRRCMDLHLVVWKIVNGDIPDGLTIDHKNREPLDNRIENLRLATVSQQGANAMPYKKLKYGYKGVRFHKPYVGRAKPWHARLGTRKHNHCSLGYHQTAHHAAFAYNCGAMLYYGEFAAPNVIPDGMVPIEDQIKIQELIRTKLVSRKMISDPKSLQMSSHA